MKSTILWIEVICPNCEYGVFEDDVREFKFIKESLTLVHSGGETECECGHIFTPILFLSEIHENKPEKDDPNQEYIDALSEKDL